MAGVTGETPVGSETFSSGWMPLCQITRPSGVSHSSVASNRAEPSDMGNVFNTVPLDGGLLTCVACHALPAGTNGMVISGNLLQEAQSIKVPQLRNLYEKTGFSSSSPSNNRGFGFIHDGSVATLFQFLQFNGFNFTGDAQRRDVEAFLMCF